MDLIRQAFQTNRCVKSLFFQYTLLYGFPRDLPDWIRELEARVRFMERESNYHRLTEMEITEENLRFLKMFRDCSSSRW